MKPRLAIWHIYSMSGMDSPLLLVQKLSTNMNIIGNPEIKHLSAYNAPKLHNNITTSRQKNLQHLIC